jgi:hypothetical protein
MVEVDAGIHDVHMHIQERDWVPHLSLYVATHEIGLEPVFEADFPINLMRKSHSTRLQRRYA